MESGGGPRQRFRRAIPRALAIAAAASLLQACASTRPPRPIGAPAFAEIAVAGRPTGVTTRYIGACEGSAHFDVADLRDLGINTYRVYGGMVRWEREDDDGVYGSPTIQQIKADLGVVNWEWWDRVMSDPPGGSDYTWAGGEWRGSARDLFGALKGAGIRTVLVLRVNDGPNHAPWAPNPPRTAADWNEWWQHVFAVAYWLNVRNDYRVDDFEVHNEPDLAEQGWRGGCPAGS